jgi:phosphocarrier protein
MEETTTPRMSRAVVRLHNRYGMHARPASMWVQTANAYVSSVRVGRVHDEERIDGKSIMSMMMLAAENGTELEIVAEGPDCEAAVRALQELVDSGFGEE